MSNAAAYFKAAIPEPYQILGKKLKPFSLGHFILMARFEVAFASDVEVAFPPTREGLKDAAENLILAILICSKTHDEFLAFISEPDFGKQIRAWRKSLGAFNILQKVALFQSYMRAGMEMPKFSDAGEGKESGAHWTQSVKVILAGELGYTIPEALNSPLSQSLADYFKWAENQGLVELLSDDELAQIAALEKGGVSQPQS